MHTREALERTCPGLEAFSDSRSKYLKSQTHTKGFLHMHVNSTVIITCQATNVYGGNHNCYIEPPGSDLEDDTLGAPLTFTSVDHVITWSHYGAVFSVEESDLLHVMLVESLSPGGGCLQQFFTQTLVGRDKVRRLRKKAQSSNNALLKYAWHDSGIANDCTTFVTTKVS